MRIKNEAGEIIKAGCIVIEGDKILLITTKDRSVWAYPKGHIEPEEDAIDAARRETLEETGHEVKIIRRLEDLTYRKADSNEPVRVAMFLASPIRKVTDATEEIWEWIPVEDARGLVLPNLRLYLEDHNLKG